MGKAIIAPDQPNIRELIDDGETGMLIRPEAPGSLAEAVVALAKSPEQRTRLAAQAARAVVDRGLTWEANASRVEGLMQSVVRQAETLATGAR